MKATARLQLRTNRREIMTTDLIKVVLADDHAVGPRGCQAVLSSAKDIQVIGEVSNMPRRCCDGGALIPTSSSWICRWADGTASPRRRSSVAKETRAGF
jgi:hypothetical protein